MLFYFYHVLTASNKMEIMSEVVLLLLPTIHHQQDGDYVRGCSTSTIVLTAFNKMEIMSHVVLLLPSY